MSPGAVFLISASAIAFQIALMRLYAIAQWHHFAYMIISICMLGFAASGTLIALFREKVEKRAERLFEWTSWLLIAAPSACYALAQGIPFETFRLATQPSQLGFLLLLYLVLSLPFFLVSACLTLALMVHREHIGRVYFLNMAGSGAGALGILLLLDGLPAELAPHALAVPLALAYVLTGRKGAPTSQRFFRLILPALLVVLAAWVPLRISEYKGLAHAMRLPDARVVAERNSPMSRVTAVASQYIRETPGQISNYDMAQAGPLPEQIGLFFDAGGNSVINRFDGDWGKLAFLDHVTGALPFHLLEKPRVLMIGPGGGTGVLSALSHGATHVTAVEADPELFPLMTNRFREFSGNVYGRPEVVAVTAEGRAFLQSHSVTYDLIQLSLLDSFGASAAGVHALSENYLYTREAIELYWRRLNPGGMLALTRWLKSPPRDAVKLFATLVEAGESLGLEDPGQHLAMIRSWNTATLVFTREPISPTQNQAIRRFCGDRQFDPCWYPGMRPEEANRYTIMEQPVYFQAAEMLLSPNRESFYEDYLFDVRPARDDRPYFSHFFKWRALPLLLKGMGVEWIPFVEWGYLALLATLLQALIASCFLVLLPLLAKKIKPAGPAAPSTPIGAIISYFGALGLAFMFLEMAFIQKFTLMLDHPLQAVSVVLTALLFFAGLGSIAADRSLLPARKLLTQAVVGIAALALVYQFILPSLVPLIAGVPSFAKMAMCILLLAPLAFAMGMPFPIGAQRVASHFGAALPWVWCINGCASVLGACLGTLLAIEFGFIMVVGLGTGFYFIALTAFLVMRRSTAAHSLIAPHPTPPRDQT